MSDAVFRLLTMTIAIIFVAFFCITIVPPLLDNPDLMGALGAGFVNPYASGYSTDVILCWVLLVVWVLFERKNHSVKHGWICLIVGVVPGVVVGLASYLLLRHRHFHESRLGKK